jgi:hypothetical protein
LISFGLPCLKERGNSRVLETGAGLSFAQQTISQVGRESASQDLQRAIPAQCQIVCTVDFPHSASPDSFLEPVVGNDAIGLVHPFRLLFDTSKS